MKNIYVNIIFIIAVLMGVFTSCNDVLDLSPIDYYGSESYSENEAHADAYIDGIHKHLRDVAWQHMIVFGELRGGTYISGVTADGSKDNHMLPGYIPQMFMYPINICISMRFIF